MKYLAITGWLLALTAIAFILSDSHCNKSVSHSDTTTVTVTTFDTVPYMVAVPVSKPLSETLRLPAEKWWHDPAGYDTNCIKGHSGDCKGDSGIAQPLILDYYTVRYYQDSFSDSNLVGVLKDSVYMNRILWHGFNYKLIRPITITTNTVINKKEDLTRIYAGVGISTGQNIGLGPELMYCKDQWAYRAGYHLNSSNPFQVSVLIKLNR